MKKVAYIKMRVAFDRPAYSITINGEVNSIHFGEETLATAVESLEILGYKVVRE